MKLKLLIIMKYMKTSIKTGYILNDKHVYEKFLEKHNFEKLKQPRKFNNKKYTIG